MNACLKGKKYIYNAALLFWLPVFILYLIKKYDLWTI